MIMEATIDVQFVANCVTSNGSSVAFSLTIMVAPSSILGVEYHLLFTIEDLQSNVEGFPAIGRW